MKSAAIALWISAFAVLVLVSIEGGKLHGNRAQKAALQADYNVLEATLVERVRNRRPRPPPRPTASGETNPTQAAEPDFASAPPLAWVRTAHLKDAGRATPKAAFESALWAATQANVDALTEMISLQEADRKLVESFLAKLPYPSGDAYGTPEHLMALFMAEDPPAAVQLYTIEPALSKSGAMKGLVNVIALTQDTNGQPGYLSYTFQHTDNGWQMVSPNLWGGGIQAYLAKIAAPAPN